MNVFTLCGYLGTCRYAVNTLDFYCKKKYHKRKFVPKCVHIWLQCEEKYSKPLDSKMRQIFLEIILVPDAVVWTSFPVFTYGGLVLEHTAWSTGAWRPARRPAPEARWTTHSSTACFSTSCPESSASCSPKQIWLTSRRWAQGRTPSPVV